ncbi:hypothetical protein CY34DRAFT_624697 [Suillus luteus UH-Slu-Lm8-n1]|uniref:DUF6534 domain-containing protein n=1 Tax=Suillus luteus UH-Slu-Lm8-n1 TaxID=930992 RepID=A0A0D0AS10_9AGAM|nr:hypothetical protein CY34DRAFT_624697 [Suillus luteus UH-Slu-Lm8-n1]
MSDAAPAYDTYVRGWGPGVIGYIFALWLSGLTVGQMVFYLKVYAHDHRGIKAAVVFVFVLDMVHTYCTSALFWRLLVGCRRNTSPECLLLPREMFAGIFLSSTITVSVQCFYAHRVCIISDKNWKLTGAVVVTALGQYGLGIAVMVSTAVSRSAIVFFACPFDIPYSAASVVCDVLISGSCLFYLRPGRNGVQHSNNYLQGLLVITLQMGVLTSLVAIVWFMLYFIQGIRYWTGFPAAILCKSHFNSMLVVLNARKSIRSQLKDHVPSLSTIPMNIVSDSSTEPSEP